MRSIFKGAIFGAILICGRNAPADVQYTKLCDFGKAPDFEAISIDCRHCGVTRHKDGKEIMMIDGVPQSPYEMVGNLLFSDDGGHYGYSGRNFVGGDEVPDLILDGKTINYKNGGNVGLRFGPHGKPVIVGVYKGGWHYTLDGKDLPGEFMAYPDVTFTPDGLHFAYAADVDGKLRAVVDGKVVCDFSADNGIHLSGDGKHYAFRSGDGDNAFLVVDGKAMPKGSYYVAFSDDGTHTAYIQKDGEKRTVVVDGKPGATYAKVEALLYTPHTNHLIYVGTTDEGSCLFTDGKPGPVLAELHDDYVSVSADGQHIAYPGLGDDWHIHLDGKPLTEAYDDCSAPVFSADGKHLAFWAKKADKQFIVVDGKAQAGFADVNAAAFSADGKHVVYAVQQDKKWSVAVDGKPVSFDYPPLGEGLRFRFAEDGSLNYLALKGTELYRVTWKP